MNDRRQALLRLWADGTRAEDIARALGYASAKSVYNTVGHLRRAGVHLDKRPHGRPRGS